jgi:phosphoribosylanthranilate isomerase
MYLKICGITQVNQAIAIATLPEVSALGMIHVANTPRYVSIEQMKLISEAISSLPVDRIGLFLNQPIEEISSVVDRTGITGIQLHGSESPEFCQKLKEKLPEILLIKAFRIKQKADLAQIFSYLPFVNKLILDAYDPNLAGGTGKTLDWSILSDFKPGCEWLLAGGINPENVAEAIAQTRPDGIDLSSGVENKPGDKNLHKIAELISQINLAL